MKSGRILRGADLPLGRRFVPGPAAPLARSQASGDKATLSGPTQLVAGGPIGNVPGDITAASEVARDEAVARGLAQGMAQAEQQIAEEIERRWAAQKRDWDVELHRRKEEYGATVASLRAGLTALTRAREEIVPALEEQAIALAFEAVCRILGPETSGASDEGGLHRLLANLVSGSLVQMHGHQVHTIRLHPQDHAAVVTALGESPTGAAVSGDVQWVADPRLERLAPRLESLHGSLDASMRTQLERLMSLWLCDSEPDACTNLAAWNTSSHGVRS